MKTIGLIFSLLIVLLASGISFAGHDVGSRSGGGHNQGYTSQNPPQYQPAQQPRTYTRNQGNAYGVVPANQQPQHYAQRNGQNVQSQSTQNGRQVQPDQNGQNRMQGIQSYNDPNGQNREHDYRDREDRRDDRYDRRDDRRADREDRWSDRREERREWRTDGREEHRERAERREERREERLVENGGGYYGGASSILQGEELRRRDMLQARGISLVNVTTSGNSSSSGDGPLANIGHGVGQLLDQTRN